MSNLQPILPEGFPWLLYQFGTLCIAVHVHAPMVKKGHKNRPNDDQQRLTCAALLFHGKLLFESSVQDLCTQYFLYLSARMIENIIIID